MARASGTAAPAADVIDVAGSLRLSITRLARILRHQDAEGLTPSTISALATLNREGPMTLGDLAAHEHVAAPTVTRIVEKLQRDGLVTRSPSERDGRVVYVEVTAEARRMIENVRSRRTAWLTSRLSDLSPKELEVLRRAAPILERLVIDATQQGAS